MDIHNFLRGLVIWAPPAILAITLHEAAHGFVAKYFGDSTAYMLGRMTLNPIKHVDPMGTIVIPLVIGLLTGWKFIFGWAKPVPVNFNNLRHPKRDMLWVAAAGPASNLVQAAIWATLAKLLFGLQGGVVEYWFEVSEAGILVNMILAVLNLLPILPLDGGRILASLLPKKASYVYQGTERYGLFILVALIVTGLLGRVLGPLVSIGVVSIYSIFGLPLQ